MSTNMTQTDTRSDGSKLDRPTDQPESTYESSFVPRFDIWEGADELRLYGDLPGVSTDDLDVRFENRELTIHGKVKPRHEGDFLYREYQVGSFHRAFTIGETIDAEAISAEVCNGVLIVHLPKSEKIRPRRSK